MAVALGVISVVAGAVSIGMMIPSLLPDKDKHETVVRIAAGLSSNEADSTSGSTPGLTLYDTMGRQIGSVAGSKNLIRDGSFADIKVPFDPDVGKKPTEYIAVRDGGIDAICIAYVAITQPDGTKKAWYGDIAKDCLADWYVSQLKTGDDDYQPACVWIDGNRSNGLRFQGFGLHMNSFAATEARSQQFNEDRKLMCNVAPRFKMYENLGPGDLIPYFDPPPEVDPVNLTDKHPEWIMDKSHWAVPYENEHINRVIVEADPKPPPQRRDNGQPENASNRGKRFQDVIISDSPWHSAKELCHSDHSLGHDFVSLKEGLFCDMHSSPRMLWPICTDVKQGGCFDLATSQMRAGTGLRGRDVKTNMYPPKKIYRRTVRWT